MDGAKAVHRDQAALANAMRERVGGRGGSAEGHGVNLTRAASSADLGVSSKYSNENFEGRSGEGFHVKINSTWVSRS